MGDNWRTSWEIEKDVSQRTNEEFVVWWKEHLVIILEVIMEKIEADKEIWNLVMEIQLFQLQVTENTIQYIWWLIACQFD
jgi:hypothetical protein